MGRIIKLTESDLHNMVFRAVQNIKESFDFGGGFDEASAATPDDGRPQDSDSKKAQQKRNSVLTALRRSNSTDEMEDSRVRRRAIIYRLYNVSDDKDYDTYRSLFSKCLDPDDSAHQFSDGQINIIYDMISDIL